MGVVPPLEGFLQGLRDITNEYGSLLIFDEVMTGFRVGYNCAQGYFGVTPDLTCLEKLLVADYQLVHLVVKRNYGSNSSSRKYLSSWNSIRKSFSNDEWV